MKDSEYKRLRATRTESTKDRKCAEAFEEHEDVNRVRGL